MKVHVIGVCGVGMSATALLMKEAGWHVTGSDSASYGPTGRILKNADIIPSIGYDAKNIPSDADFFVIGRNAKLSPSENKEVQAAQATGKPLRSFPEVIGMLTTGRPVTVVAGSYGKSSTTAILATLLHHVGKSGYFVGAEPLSLPAPAQLGEGLFVAEGDEYPSAHDDARAKFMHLNARDVILTSVVHDHINVYPTFEEYRKPFVDLLASLPHDGLIVVSAEEPGALSLAKASGKPMVSYGISNGDYHADHLSFGEETTFTLMKESEAIAKLSTRELGRHSVENIIAACAYVHARNLLTIEELPRAVRAFTGVRRRLERVTPEHAVPTYEGFGSSLEKARAAIDAMKLHFPARALVVVFEPHTFGWRNRGNLPWYDHIFTGVSRVYIAPPEHQGSTTHDQLSHEEIIERVSASGTIALPYDSQNPEIVAQSLTGNECVLILSSGDFEGSLPALIASLQP